jgi:hypothetical protein
MACCRQTWEQGYLSGVVLSRRCSGWWHLFGGCEALRLGYLMGVLTYLRYQIFVCSKSFLLGDAYPMSEPSWRLCMYLWSSCCVMWQWDRFQHLITCCHTRVGSCAYVPSCQAPKATAVRGSRIGNAYPLPEAPGRVWPEVCVLPRVEGGGTGEQVVKFYSPTFIVG